MVVQPVPRSITVDRSSRGFGLSLIYRGLDKYEEKDTGIFVARVVPGGQAARFGVRENDKIMTINGRTPRNVDGLRRSRLAFDTRYEVVSVQLGPLADHDGGSRELELTVEYR